MTRDEKGNTKNCYNVNRKKFMLSYRQSLIKPQAFRAYESTQNVFRERSILRLSAFINQEKKKGGGRLGIISS